MKSSDPNSIIASLSFGSNRKFYFKKKNDSEKNERLVLENGSLLVMEGKIQEFWNHSIPKELKVDKERINLTFRRLNFENKKY